jgi:hypothetical protein
MADSPLTPSSFRLSNSSPLDTLVRKTSQRRNHVNGYLSAGNVNPRTEPDMSMAQSQHTGTNNANNTNSYPQPRMPLLHSNFSRDSTATASTGTGIWYADHSYTDDASVYSDAYGDDSALRESWATGTGTAYGNTMLDNTAQVPAVIVSPVAVEDAYSAQAPRVYSGRTPSRAPAAANFSKPLRHLTPELEDSKRRVLERNKHPSSPLSQQQHPSRASSPLQQQPMDSRFEQPRPAPSPTPTLTPTAPSYLSPNTPITPVSLPGKPPSLRPDSLVSLYSNYFYYGSQPPTPTVSNTQIHSSRGSSPLSIPPAKKPTPEDYLSMGISAHEANDLAASASYFQQAATEAGGCGVGMLMWGLTLRHGWGVQSDEKAAFKWLRKAAESAVVDLEGARKGVTMGGSDITSVKVQDYFLLSYANLLTDHSQSWFWRYTRWHSASFTVGASNRTKRWLSYVLIVLHFSSCLMPSLELLPGCSTPWGR